VHGMAEGPPRIRELDFSGFHPIDHYPGTGRCRSLPGGFRRHLDLAWEFKWPQQLGRATWCRIGRHKWVDGWAKDVPCSLCRNCWKIKPPKA
jgi:hypothetical protein